MVLKLCNGTWHRFRARSEGEELTSVLVVVAEERRRFRWLDFNVVDDLFGVTGW